MIDLAVQLRDLVETRAIRLNKGWTRRVARDLAKKLSSLGGRGEVRDRLDYPGKTNGEKIPPIDIDMSWSDGKKVRGKLWTTVVKEGNTVRYLPSIDIFIPIGTKPGEIEGLVHDVLIHELTHYLDWLYRKRKDKGGEYAAQIKTRAGYYNSPSELKAFMQMVVNEVVSALVIGAKNIDQALKKSKTWRQISKHLTPRNRKTVLKAVATEIRNAGL